MPIQFSVGERFEIIQTESGNIMCDMVALLDQETVDKVRSRVRVAFVVGPLALTYSRSTSSVASKPLSSLTRTTTPRGQIGLAPSAVRFMLAPRMRDGSNSETLQAWI